MMTSQVIVLYVHFNNYQKFVRVPVTELKRDTATHLSTSKRLAPLFEYSRY